MNAYKVCKVVSNFDNSFSLSFHETIIHAAFQRLKKILPQLGYWLFAQKQCTFDCYKTNSGKKTTAKVYYPVISPVIFLTGRKYSKYQEMFIIINIILSNEKIFINHKK